MDWLTNPNKGGHSTANNTCQAWTRAKGPRAREMQEPSIRHLVGCRLLPCHKPNTGHSDTDKLKIFEIFFNWDIKNYSEIKLFQ